MRCKLFKHRCVRSRQHADRIAVLFAAEIRSYHMNNSLAWRVDVQLRLSCLIALPAPYNLCP